MQVSTWGDSFKAVQNTQKHLLLGTTRQEKHQVVSIQCHEKEENPSLAMPNHCNTASLRKLSLPQTLREHKTLQ